MVAGFQDCIQKDDFVPIYHKMLEADGIIFSCPVYFGSAPSRIRALLNRAGLCGESSEYYNIIAKRRAEQQGQPFILPSDEKSIEDGRYGKFRRKLGGAIVTTRRTGANFTYLELIQWFLIENMIVIPGIYWNIALCGAIGARDALEDEEAVHNLEIFAENFAWALPRLRK
jgi:multimeric flavodoxin WrbA